MVKKEDLPEFDVVIQDVTAIVEGIYDFCTTSASLLTKENAARTLVRETVKGLYELHKPRLYEKIECIRKYLSDKSLLDERNEVIALLYLAAGLDFIRNVNDLIIDWCNMLEPLKNFELVFKQFESTTRIIEGPYPL